jgi:hypothetical protein
MGLYVHVTGHDDAAKVEAFLCEFARAREHMKKAADALLQVRELPKSEPDKKRYDRAHKRVVRLIRDWNRIEQEREAEAVSKTGGEAIAPPGPTIPPA